MDSFFGSVRPGKEVTLGDLSAELPALYFRDDCFLLFFTADYDEVKALMPSDLLHPVPLPGSTALVGFVAFNYIETSIGPYGEVAVIVPSAHRRQPPPPIIPAILEGAYPGFGSLVIHLPVTGTPFRDGGRLGWGYPKFVADMVFTITPEFMECRMSEEDRHILTLRVARRGFAMRDRKPIITYSVLDGALIKTTIPQRASFRTALYPRQSFLKLGEHPVAESIRRLRLSPRPLLSRYYLERSAILPEGEIIERGVRPLDGYRGTARAGDHRVVYLEKNSGR